MARRFVKAATDMLDMATTRKAVMAVAAKARGFVKASEWDEVWRYAILRANRLPDDGTHLIEPGTKVAASRPLQVLDWRTGTRLSQEEERRFRRDGHNPGFEALAEKLRRMAKPYIVRATGMPPEFADWEGKSVHLNFDALEDKAYGDTLIEVFSAGVPVAFKKNGRWFKIKSHGGRITTTVDIMPIDEAEALGMLHAPADHEAKVKLEDL